MSGGLLFGRLSGTTEGTDSSGSGTSVFGGPFGTTGGAFNFGKSASSPTPGGFPTASFSALSTPAATPAVTATTQEQKKQLRAARFLQQQNKTASDATTSSASPAINPFAVKNQPAVSSSPFTDTAAAATKNAVPMTSSILSRKRPEPTEDESSGVPATKTMRLGDNLAAATEAESKERKQHSQRVGRRGRGGGRDGKCRRGGEEDDDDEEEEEEDNEGDEECNKDDEGDLDAEEDLGAEEDE